MPEGFRETMRAANVLSYRIMIFERRRDGGFRAAAPSIRRWRRHRRRPMTSPPLQGSGSAATSPGAAASASIPMPMPRRRRPRSARRDRHLLLDALAGEGLLAPRGFRQIPAGNRRARLHARAGRRDPALSRPLARAADAGADRGRRSARREQANLPGTTDAHPNWRRRLSGDPRRDHRRRTELRRIAALIREARRRCGRSMSEQSAGEIPIRATYRLQFHRGFTFRDATALVPYLAALGDQPSLCIADHRGAAGLDPRLRHRQPQPAQPRNRQRDGFRRR